MSSDPREGVVATFCPCCHYRLDAATEVFSDARPVPGDWSLCIRCCEPLVFGEDMRLRLPTEAESRDMPRAELEAIVDAIGRARRAANSSS